MLCLCQLIYHVFSIRMKNQHWAESQFSSVHSVVFNSLQPHGLQNTPGFLVHHQFPGLSQTHAHWVGDAIHPPHPLLSLSPPAFNVSKHQGALQWVSSLHQVAKVGASASASVLPMDIQGWFPLGLTGLISLQSKRLSRVFSNTTVQKHKFLGAQLSLWSNSHINTWLLEKP